MRNVDPITLSTVWHCFQTLCREMRHVMERTAQSYLMAHLKDVSVGVWLADGSTVAVPEGLMVQFLGTAHAVKSIREKFGDNLKPGDVILTNDPYHGGHNCHLPDWGFLRPVFYKGELLFFTMVRGHMMDTGGAFPGGYFANGYDIHAEGLCIPPLKIVDGGQVQEPLLELILNNVRFPEPVRVDCLAMIATTQFAEDRIVELLERYGQGTVLDCVAEMIERTERAVRQEIAAIPDGTYSGESATDDDGTVLDEPVWVRVDITVKGDELTLDFSRTDKQRKGFVNMVYAAAYADAIGTTVLHFDASLAGFHNEGSIRPIKVIAPPGTVVNAAYPATVGAAPVAMGTEIMEAVMEAFAKALPHRSMAAWGRHRGDYTFGRDPRNGKRYVRTSFEYDGSAGAVWGHDGPNGPTCLSTLASVMRGNVEEVEMRFPWRILKLEMLPDFMGAGRWRGGGGFEWQAVNEGDEGGMATGSSDGDVILGKGAQGGHSCPPCRTFIRRGDELIRVKPHRMQELRRGDVVIKLSSGGAGVGDPAERPVAAVVSDVRNDLVTPAAARLIYKVAVDPQTLAVDEGLTQALRSHSAADPHEVVVNEKTLAVEVRPVGL